ncbi:hypothetical protein ABBQ32_009027 [Trebouxia sp. C0010 RCD-2024]
MITKACTSTTGNVLRKTLAVRAFVRQYQLIDTRSFLAFEVQRLYTLGLQTHNRLLGAPALGVSELQLNRHQVEQYQCRVCWGPSMLQGDALLCAGSERYDV